MLPTYLCWSTTTFKVMSTTKRGEEREREGTIDEKDEQRALEISSTKVEALNLGYHSSGKVCVLKKSRKCRVQVVVVVKRAKDKIEN